MQYEKIRGLSATQFRKLTGVKRCTFGKMVSIICESNQLKRVKGGRKKKLKEEDMLFMSLECLREYRTYFHIGQSYGVSESAAYKTIKWVEYTLIKHPDFALPGKKALYQSDMAYQILVIDSTETPIKKPKKNPKKTQKKQRYFYSGKKKRHTIKTQMIISKSDRKVCIHTTLKLFNAPYC